MNKMDKIIPECSLENLLEQPRVKELSLSKIIGVYFLVENNEVVYVGQSTDIASRIRKHQSDKFFNKVFYIECRKERLNEIENYFIISFNPEYNRTHNAVIAINKFRLHNNNLTNFQKNCIEVDTAEKACTYLGIKY